MAEEVFDIIIDFANFAHGIAWNRVNPAEMMNPGNQNTLFQIAIEITNIFKSATINQNIGGKVARLKIIFPTSGAYSLDAFRTIPSKFDQPDLRHITDFITKTIRTEGLKDKMRNGPSRVFIDWIWAGKMTESYADTEAEKTKKIKDFDCKAKPPKTPDDFKGYPQLPVHTCESPDDLLVIYYAAKAISESRDYYVISGDKFRSEYYLINGCTEHDKDPNSISIKDIIAKCKLDDLWVKPENSPREWSQDAKKWSHSTPTDGTLPEFYREQHDYKAALNEILFGGKRYTVAAKARSSSDGNYYGQNILKREDYPPPSKAAAAGSKRYRVIKAATIRVGVDISSKAVGMLGLGAVITALEEKVNSDGKTRVRIENGGIDGDTSGWVNITSKTGDKLLEAIDEKPPGPQGPVDVAEPVVAAAAGSKRYKVLKKTSIYLNADSTEPTPKLGVVERGTVITAVEEKVNSSGRKRIRIENEGAANDGFRRSGWVSITSKTGDKLLEAIDENSPGPQELGGAGEPVVAAAVDSDMVDCTAEDRLGPKLFSSKNQGGVEIDPKTCGKILTATRAADPAAAAARAVAGEEEDPPPKPEGEQDAGSEYEIDLSIYLGKEVAEVGGNNGIEMFKTGAGTTPPDPLSGQIDLKYKIRSNIKLDPLLKDIKLTVSDSIRDKWHTVDEKVIERFTKLRLFKREAGTVWVGEEITTDDQLNYAFLQLSDESKVADNSFLKRFILFALEAQAGSGGGKKKKTKRKKKNKKKRTNKRSKTRKNKKNKSRRNNKTKKFKPKMPGAFGDNVTLQLEFPNKSIRWVWLVKIRDDDRFVIRSPKIGVLVRELKLKRDKDFGPEKLAPKGTKIFSKK
jgi:hypothetical protein